MVGPGGRVCGIDLSADMLAVAARRDPGTDAAAVELELAGAEAIPYADGSFDAVVSTQVLEYVPDVP
ncbi:MULTISPECIES: methyltransferase domain-containing protein, partial [unclassified Nocardioides]|uniref:methyltransferase domain-containing protein n=1 Tax=unclassified Nocardioides TaxID=2615069 RepID=UPI003621A4D2